MLRALSTLIVICIMFGCGESVVRSNPTWHDGIDKAINILYIPDILGIAAGIALLFIAGGAFNKVGIALIAFWGGVLAFSISFSIIEQYLVWFVMFGIAGTIGVLLWYLHTHHNAFADFVCNQGSKIEDSTKTMVTKIIDNAKAKQ